MTVGSTVIAIAGIYFFFCTQSFVQQKLYRQNAGFRFTLCLLFVTCSVSAIVASVGLYLQAVIRQRERKQCSQKRRQNDHVVQRKSQEEGDDSIELDKWLASPDASNHVRKFTMEEKARERESPSSDDHLSDTTADETPPIAWTVCGAEESRGRLLASIMSPPASLYSSSPGGGGMHHSMEGGMVTESPTRQAEDIANTCGVLLNGVVGTVKRTLGMRSTTSSEDSQAARDAALAGLTFVIAKFCGWHALTVVDFTTQSVAKCAKPVAILVVTIVQSRLGQGKNTQHCKRYSTLEKLAAVWIVGALFVFNVSRPKVPSRSTQQLDALYLLIANLGIILGLACEGLTGAQQDRLANETRFSKMQIMLAINVAAAAFAFPLMLGLELEAFCLHVLRNPMTVLLVGGFALTGALGQLFLYHAICSIGAMNTAIITTTRKCLVVLLSIFVFQSGRDATPLSPRQWGAVSAIFAAVLLKLGNSLMSQSGADKSKLNASWRFEFSSRIQGCPLPCVRFMKKAWGFKSLEV